MPQLTKPSGEHDFTAPPIEARDLSVVFNGTKALEDLTFRVESGQRVAVVGPNGAGKTTLLQVIAGVLEPSSGSVRIHGHAPGHHICVAYVPQRSRVDWDFPVTVSDVVMMGRVREIGLFRWPQRKDRVIVERALDQVGMGDLASRQIGELSGGQQQRVFLAQAVAQEADVFLLDEPLSGLDVPSQEAILDLLDELPSRGATVLFATHDLNLAATRFDEVMLLNRRLVALGPPSRTFTRETLQQAYGDRLHEVQDQEGAMVLTDPHLSGGP